MSEEVTMPSLMMTTLIVFKESLPRERHTVNLFSKSEESMKTKQQKKKRKKQNPVTIVYFDLNTLGVPTHFGP